MTTMNIADYELQKIAMEALRKSLGVAGLIRFMQQFDQGHVDYTVERQKWQSKYSADQIYAEIKAKDKLIKP